MTPRLAILLEGRGIPFDVLPHAPDYSSQQTARHTHTPGRAFAKAVVFAADGEYGMAVLPADRRVDLEKLRRRLEADEVYLAPESRMVELFPDCELGAEPPLGNLYGLPVYLSTQLASQPVLTFNGGRHDQAVRMGIDNFVRLVQPKVFDFVEA